LIGLIHSRTLLGVEIHLDLERLCSGLGPEEIGLPSPSPDVDVWGPRGAVVADLPDDVSPADGVPLLYFNVPDMSVSDGDAVLLVFEDNEPCLSIPVHGPGLVGTVRPGYPDDLAFKRGEDILSPSIPVFVLFSGCSRLIGPADAILSDFHHGEVPGQLVNQTELGTIGMLSGVEVHPAAGHVDRRMDQHRLGQGVVFEIESWLGAGLRRDEHETGKHDAEGAKET
jgi:hypothetical protein